MINTDFSRNLIKGRIAESIFEEMFKQSEEFTLIPIGYEHTIPELAQYQHHVQVRQVLNNLRSAPDFALISQDKESVFLVEVKYRRELNRDELLSVAEKLNNNWNPSFLFIATQDYFGFDSALGVINHHGNIKKLQNTWISADIQQQYLHLLREFVN